MQIRHGCFTSDKRWQPRVEEDDVNVNGSFVVEVQVEMSLFMSHVLFVEQCACVCDI